MNKKRKRTITSLASAAMAFNMLCVPVLASPVAAGNHFDQGVTMQPTKQVYSIGSKAFYKIQGDAATGFSVVFADREEDPDYKAVPSAYIQGSEFNKGNASYGIYVTQDNKVHFINIEDCAFDGTNYFYDHATTDGAVVSEEVDTATNEDTDMSTQFYLNIENGIDPDGVVTEEVFGATTNDPNVEYEITVGTKTSYQLSATVPMYVGMYGYSGTGNVITPTEDAYEMKNYSTMNKSEDATITDITRITHMTKLYDEDHSDDSIYSIAYNKDTHEYRYWYSDPAGTQPADDTWEYKVIDDMNINASGQCYAICIDRDSDGTYEWEFAKAGELDGDALRESVTKVGNDAGGFVLDADFVHGEWNFGTAPEIGQVETDQDNSDEGMAIKITELQAEPATWKLIPTKTKLKDIERGELIMSLAPEKAKHDASAIDLSSASNFVDIGAKGWFVDAPDKVTNGAVLDEDATSLGFKTKAQMAGGDVNASGHTPVVKVNYKITPVFDPAVDDE